MFIDLVVGEGTGGDALVRPLEVIVRRVVERGRTRREDPAGADLQNVAAAGADVVALVDVKGQRIVHRLGIVNADRIVGEEGAIGRGRRAGAHQTGAVGARTVHGASRVVTVALGHLVGLAVADIGHEVAAAFRDLAAERHRGVEGAAIGGVAVRHREITQLEQALNRAVAVVVLVEAVLRIDLDALELRIHHEVDDAGDGIRTIDGRRAAGQHIDALHDRRRNEVDVGHRRGLGRVTRHQATAVDQHHGTRRAKATQVDGGRTGGAVGEVGTLTGERLRQVVDEILGAGHTLKLDFLGTQHRHRADAVKIRTRDARTGDDDRLDGFGCLRGFLRHGRCRRSQQRRSDASLQRRPIKGGLVGCHVRVPLVHYP